ncbi:MAG: aminotransferase class III-fold pyridoxal phosphate-dependent enzyme [Deltaproteobacteria bacterium]|nr:aminotransferase class III-fold pyridoxal phosphate-dependent enzyme [Deltaproteobacteria bacterium]
MKRIDPELLGDQYAQYVRPQVAKLLKLLKLDLVYVGAEGDQLQYADGESTHDVIDLLGGYGSTLLGHNNAELIDAVKSSLDARVPVHAQASIRPGAVQVAMKLNELLALHGGEPRRFITTLCNSGAEAVEAAIKHALMEWQQRRARLIDQLEGRRADLVTAGEKNSSVFQIIDGYLETLARLQPAIVAVEGSFHGKTAGSVSVTTNLEFKGMYASSPIHALFLSRTENLEQARQNLAHCKHASPVEDVSGFSAVAGVLFEAIQGEGGIQCLTPEFAAVLKSVGQEHDAPLIADEIQCGLFRTGRFIAAHAVGLKPDYILLGKSLGGGLAKISALLVVSNRYQAKFGFVHTSTFSEDEMSSLVALKTLQILSREADAIKKSAAAFEALVRGRVAGIQARYPGVLREVRGRGYLLGIEFNFGGDAPIPTILHTIHQAGFATYIYASYLMHRHKIRVGVTLSKPDTLRLEPSAFIREENTVKFLDGLEQLCGRILERKLVDLTRHFWAREFEPKSLETVSPLRYAPIRNTSKVRKVGFLSHLVNDTAVRLMDPFLRAIGHEGRDRFQSKFGPITGPVLYHEQLIKGAGGTEIHLHCYGVFLPSKYFEVSHLAGDGKAMAQVQGMAERALRDEMEFVGLGQYTSIVSKNGLLLRRLGLNVTSGNGLTAGYAFQGVQQTLRESGRSLADVHVGVVGAAGNICSVVTQLLADEARELTLVFREGTENGARARATLQAVLAHSRIAPERIKVTGKITDLRDCDVVVMGTNSADSVVFPEHLKESAIVMDVSVPSNIDERVFTERKDVRCYQGGRARLPLGQSLSSEWMPAPVGETYACMGETICGGLLAHPGNLSIGPVSKADVLLTLEMAKKVGMEMGTLRRVSRA